MTETIMFNFDSKVRSPWAKALSFSRLEVPGSVDEWCAYLANTYGIEPVMLESGIAGVRIVDEEKVVLFKLRWM